MILTILEIFFTISTATMIAYLIRHYIFTFSVLKYSKNKEKTSVNIPYEPAVTILIPARNEEKVIERLLKQIILLTYPKNKLEVIVIDDDSCDDTGKIADNYSKKANFIKVLHREKPEGGRGKPAALNAALKLSKGEIILCFDADYIPEVHIVQKLVTPFHDLKIGAVQGRPVVLNEPENIVTRMIALERTSGYQVDQAARDKLNLIPQFGGTVGGFRRCIIEQLGGFDESKLTEDTDLTFEIILAGYEVRYVGDAECYEEAVDNWRAYWRQRHRWSRGHMQVCFKHVFNVLGSKKLSFKQKVDGFLLLNIYFIPILALFSFLVGTALVLYGSKVAGVLWLSVPIAFYSFVGNFAPFFEVGIGSYLDGRRRTQWLMPFLLFSFLLNILICLKAFFDEILDILRHKPGQWIKTEHPNKEKSYYELVLKQLSEEKVG